MERDRRDAHQCLSPAAKSVREGTAVALRIAATAMQGAAGEGRQAAGPQAAVTLEARQAPAPAPECSAQLLAAPGAEPQASELPPQATEMPSMVRTRCSLELKSGALRYAPRDRTIVGYSTARAQSFSLDSKLRVEYARAH